MSLASPLDGNGNGVSPAQSDWQRYASSIGRHKWLVLILTLAGTALGIVATRFLDPLYTAKAILWVETAAGRERGVESEELLDSRGWIDVVTSNAVLDTVVHQLRLYARPVSWADSVPLRTLTVSDRVIGGRYRLVVAGDSRMRLELADGGVAQRAKVGEALGQAFGFRWAPPPETLKPGKVVEFDVIPPRDASGQLAKALRVRLDPGGNFLRIELKGANPTLLAATLNSIANRVVEVEAEMKRRKFQELADVLSEQYRHAQESLAAAEDALKEFRTQNAGSPVMGDGLEPRGDPITTQNLRVELDQLIRDRRAIEQAISRARTSGISVDALNAIPSVKESPGVALALEELTKKQAELRTLRYQYTTESAPVRQLMGEIESLERRTIPSLARQLTQELVSRASRVASRKDSTVRVLTAVPTVALSDNRLVREQANAEEIFNNVRQRYDAARLELVSSQPDVRILDPAVVPRRPARDYAPLVILLAFAASFGLAVVGVTVVDRFDPKLRAPEQVTGQMHLPILGAVPHVSWRANGDSSAPVIEALRVLRLRLAHAHGRDGPMLLTVTSPSIGDGKSFVSVNLALSFADAGYHTLLIDGDVRRGVQHRTLKTASTPGLTDVAAGRVPLETALRSTLYPGLTFLSAGTRMQRAPERLLLDSMRDLITRLRGMYSTVIIDSPPLVAGVDPLVLGTLTENLLLVVRAGATDLKLATAKLEVLNSLPIRVLGAVLNDVRGNGAYRYYTYSTPEYELMDEERPLVRQALPNVLGGRS
jgi:capsular exopolysaccharide synthesis family protein